MIRYGAAAKGLTKRSMPIRLSENTNRPAPSAARLPQASARQSMALIAVAYTATGISSGPRPWLASTPNRVMPVRALNRSAGRAGCNVWPQ